MLQSFLSSVCVCQKGQCSLANTQKWDVRKTECVFHQSRARAMLSACTKCLFTPILKTPLPLATQEPGELLWDSSSLETLGFWHR